MKVSCTSLKEINMYLNSVYFVFLLWLTAVYSDSEINSTVNVPVGYHQNDSFNIHDERIKNGYTIDIFYANFYVFVQCHVNCGGSLVRLNKVITAAHCVDKCAVKKFQIAVGLNAYSDLSKARKYKAKSIRIHPKYNIHRIRYDAAVVTLAQNVELNFRVGTINYANTIPPVGGWLCIYGYGAINLDNEKPEHLQKAAVSIINRKGSILYTEACTGACALWGDSGGPALYNNQLVGIASQFHPPKRNNYIAIGHPDIFNFIRKYAP